MKGIMKDAFLLFVITLVAGACLGAVHEVTLEPIAKAQLAANTATYKEVFPEAASFEQTDELKAAVEAGAAHSEPEFKGQFTGKAAQTLEVTKTAPSADNQIQAISGATYTSNAVTGAANAAIYFVENCIGE